MTCFAFPKEKLTTYVVIVWLKTLLLNPRHEENYLTAASRTKNSFRDCFVPSEAPVPRKPWTSVFRTDLYSREIQHKAHRNKQMRCFARILQARLSVVFCRIVKVGSE